jgi:hypothetical protein
VRNVRDLIPNGRRNLGRPKNEAEGCDEAGMLKGCGRLQSLAQKIIKRRACSIRGAK